MSVLFTKTAKLLGNWNLILNVVQGRDEVLVSLALGDLLRAPGKIQVPSSELWSVKEHWWPWTIHRCLMSPVVGVVQFHPQSEVSSSSGPLVAYHCIAEAQETQNVLSTNHSVDFEETFHKDNSGRNIQKLEPLIQKLMWRPLNHLDIYKDEKQKPIESHTGMEMVQNQSNCWQRTKIIVDLQYIFLWLVTATFWDLINF